MLAFGSTLGAVVSEYGLCQPVAQGTSPTHRYHISDTLGALIRQVGLLQAPFATASQHVIWATTCLAPIVIHTTHWQAQAHQPHCLLGCLSLPQ